MSEESFKMSKL